MYHCDCDGENVCEDCAAYSLELDDLARAEMPVSYLDTYVRMQAADPVGFYLACKNGTI